MGERTVSIGRDAQGNAIVTGSNNSLRMRSASSSWNLPSAPARDILWSKLPFRLDDG
jgi:hypothetical protein